MFTLVFFARGMDLLSTRLATPKLTLEGNPVAKKLGWYGGSLASLVICFVFAFWPLTAIIIATSSLLVAAHNFHAAWLMRTMGEEAYRDWFLARVLETPWPLYVGCLLGETLLTAMVGVGVVCFSPATSIPFAIGLGILAYGAIVLIFTSLSLWRLRRRME